MSTLALDIGGTKFAAAAVEPDGRLGPVSTTATPATGVWAACEQLLRRVAGRTGDVTAVGIASAGPVDTVAGTVGPINIAEWRPAFPIVDAVRSLFPRATVHLAIDGACAALAEHRHGAGRGVADLLGVVVSTGVGGGVVMNGRVVHGRSGNAGHIGHMVAPGADDDCPCGGHGCLETVASGPSCVRWARAHGWSSDTYDGVSLAAAARAGDPVAAEALGRAGRALGALIAASASLLDVEMAVVGGGFAAAGPALWDPMRQAVATHAALSYLSDFRVVPAQLDALSTLVGASCLNGR